MQDNSTRTKSTKPPKTQALSISQQEFVDIIEETLRETVNDLGNLGKTIRLTASIVLEVAALFEKSGSVNVGKVTGTRGLITPKLVKEIEEKVKEKSGT